MRATAAGFLRISHIATRTRIHRSDEREPTGISTAHVYTVYRDLTVFEGLSQSLEEGLIEFEELVKKEYSLMSERYLSWFRISSSSDDRSLTRGMVYDTKRSLSDDGHLLRQESCYRVYLRELYLLFDFHRREYPRKSTSEHRLS